MLQKWEEATTDGVWHPAECKKMPIISIKVPVYNWSSYYAMAVIELGQAVKAEMNKPGR